MKEVLISLTIIQIKHFFSSDTTEVNLRIYLGDEYECPRGHRFFCSGPEKIIKVSSTSSVKVTITDVQGEFKVISCIVKQGMFRHPY